MDNAVYNVAVRRDGPSLSLRARMLLALEPWFPPIKAPEATGEHARWEYEKASRSYADAVDELGGIQGKRVMDFGCGWGGESAWLAERAGTGGSVVGVDICRSSLDDAEAFRAAVGLKNLRFELIENDRLPFGDNEFDAVFSTNVFEHVMQPETMLREIRRVLRPGGSFISRFGPLFHSPLGYHLPWAVQVPYAHLLFGLRAMIEVRNTKRSPIDPGSWEETGLNRITFGRFRRAARGAGFEAVRLHRVPVRGLKMLAGLPVVGNLLTFGVDCHLRK